MEKVKKGDALTIQAATWNAFIDTANYVKSTRQNQAGNGIRSGTATGIILMKNAESADAEQFSALVITDIAVLPAVNEDEFRSCPPVFIGKRMTSSYEDFPYAILQEPIAAGEIGRVMILGVTPAQVSIGSSDDTFAIPTSGSSTGALESSSAGVARILWKAGSSGLQWCLLQLGGAGGGGDDKALLCKVNGGSTTTGYDVTVYPNGRAEEGTERAMLFPPELALGSTLPSGSWILGHRAMLKVTGGSEK